MLQHRSSINFIYCQSLGEHLEHRVAVICPVSGQQVQVPADHPVLGLGADVQGSSGGRIVQVQLRRSGISARRVKAHRMVLGRQTFDLLQTTEKLDCQFIGDAKR